MDHTLKNKNMHRLLLLVTVYCYSLCICGQIKVSSWCDGYWGEWFPLTSVKVYGNYSGFTLYYSNDHPSQFMFRFQIDSYKETTNKERKVYRKNKKWIEYTGTVEYYVSETYPTIKDIIKAKQFPLISPTRVKENEPCVKRTTSAKICIEPNSYIFYPRNYAIWFDGIGVGIHLKDFYFED